MNQAFLIKPTAPLALQHAKREKWVTFTHGQEPEEGGLQVHFAASEIWGPALDDMAPSW